MFRFKFILLILFAFSAQAFSAEKVSDVVQESPFYLDSFAIIDIQKILDESKASKSAREQVSTLKQKYINETNAEGKRLLALENQIKSQQKALSPEAFAKKVKDFQNSVNQSQINLMKKKKVLQAAYAKSLGLIRDTVIKIVTELAAERNIDLVLVKGTILYGKKEVEITDEVLNRLNKRLSKVTISIQKN
ncbi:MAG TPA: hypothetical protein DIV86_04895 [Alphaproteobacteria bacterium]|nr:hypothetical protein [Alphaproteobacteria bacterium]